jgi:hypothetical protein
VTPVPRGSQTLYDNDRCLVAKILPDGTRQRATLFEPGSCRITFSATTTGGPTRETTRATRRGWSATRASYFMVPIPRFATWDAFNDYLETQCLKRQADVLRGQSETIGQRLARDLAVMSNLPAAPFDACDQATGRVSSQAFVRYKSSSVKKTIRGIVFSEERLLGAGRLRPS